MNIFFMSHRIFLTLILISLIWLTLACQIHEVQPHCDSESVVLSELIEKYSRYTRHRSFNYDATGRLIHSKDSLAYGGGVYNLRIEEYIYSEDQISRIYLSVKNVRRWQDEYLEDEYNDQFSVYRTGPRIDSIVSDKNRANEKFLYDLDGNLRELRKYNEKGEFISGTRYTSTDSTFRYLFSVRTFGGSSVYSIDIKTSVPSSTKSPLKGMLPFRYEFLYYSPWIPEKIWISNNFDCYPENVNTHVPFNITSDCANLPLSQEKGVELHACFSRALPNLTTFNYSYY